MTQQARFWHQKACSGSLVGFGRTKGFTAKSAITLSNIWNWKTDMERWGCTKCRRPPRPDLSLNRHTCFTGSRNLSTGTQLDMCTGNGNSKGLWKEKCSGLKHYKSQEYGRYPDEAVNLLIQRSTANTSEQPKLSTLFISQCLSQSESRRSQNERVSWQLGPTTLVI